MVSKTESSPAVILPSRAGSALTSAGVELGDRVAGALQVGVEVPQVGLGVAVLFAGDLAFGDLFDQFGGTVGHVDRLDVDRGGTAP